jgi:chromosomal replication initiation ATPase DnaA
MQDSLPAREIAKQVAARHHVKIEEIRRGARSRHVIAARAEAIAAVYRAKPDWTLRRIAREFNTCHRAVARHLERTGART